MRRSTGVLFAFILLASMSRADTIFTYSLTIDDCSGGCGTAPFGNIKLDDNGAGTVTVTETLSSTMIYANSGAGDALAFNLLLPTDPTLVVNVLTAGFTYEGAGSFHDDGTGTFTNAIDCTGCGSGTSAPQLSGPLMFTITSGTGISAADFIKNSSGNFFASDVGSLASKGGTGNTGDVAANSGSCTSGPDCGGGIQSLPEPLTLWLTGAGLSLVGLLRKRPAA